jgi:predicted Zn-ribbon and HTH transcriptional regulator
MIEILEILEEEIDFHRNHETPLEVVEFLHLRNMRTPQELVIHELEFLKHLMEREDVRLRETT